MDTTTTKIRTGTVGICAAAAVVTCIAVGQTPAHATQAATECGAATTSYPRDIDEHVDFRKALMVAAYVARR